MDETFASNLTRKANECWAEFQRKEVERKWMGAAGVDSGSFHVSTRLKGLILGHFRP